nr:protein angel homolog 2 isoform X2 [Pelodiscus sinensis]|eukprot:XP_025042184.1 protein angel homolog 2 isoform X2 [Pelodiscus sinensis]
MLPRHMQRLGRDWVAHWDVPQRFCWNSHLSSCIRWDGHHSWAPYLSTGDFTVNWRPPHFLEPWRPPHFLEPWRPPHFLGPWRPPHFLGPWRPCQYWNWQPDNFTQNSLFHPFRPNMISEGDEPSSKRRRHSGQYDICSPSEEINSSNQNEAVCLSTPPKNEEANTANVRGIIKRHWEYFCHKSKKMKILEDKQIDQNNTEDKGKFDFTVMSYNILSQNLLEDNSHLYKHCRQPVLFWGYRFPNILREIQQLDADVLCLQEVQEDHYGMEIKPSLESLGYHCEYKMRTGRKPDGCAICFKISKFNLLSSNPVEFFRHDIPLLDRDNVGLVLLLQPRFHCKATAAVCIANTHLLYNPRRGDIKLTQLAMLLAEIASVAHRKDDRFCPIIICGDFNSVPGSPLYSFIKEGKLNYEGLPIGKVSGQEQVPRGQRILTIPIWPPSLGISQSCLYEVQQQRQEDNTDGEIKEGKLENTEEIIIAPEKFPSKLQHHFRLSSVYSHYIPESGIREVTTCHSRSAVTVDYIFYSAAKEDSAAHPGAEDVFDGGLKLLGRLSLLTEQDLWAVNGLPNEHNSSDHLSLLAQFRLTEQ